tara:strand:+ start:125 stop:265 length:141 start_codon:yes stop_codon:yes gene_type:complete
MTTKMLEAKRVLKRQTSLSQSQRRSPPLKLPLTTEMARMAHRRPNL